MLRDEQGSPFLLDADFANNRYWYNGTTYPSYAEWKSAVGETFTRASVAGYRDTGGAWQQAVSGAERFTHDNVGTNLGLLLEGNRVQQLTAPSAPDTQSKSLAAGTYSVWMEGSGSVTLSGGPTDVVTATTPATFTLGGTTSVTFTVAGTVTRFQCELAYPSSFMASSRTANDVATTGPNGSSIPFTGFSATEGTVVVHIRTANGFLTADQVLVRFDDTTNNEIIAISRSSGGANIAANVTDGGVLQAAPSFGGISNNQDHDAALAWKLNDIGFSVDGQPDLGDIVATIPTVTRMTLGHKAGSDLLFGPIARIAYTPRRVPNLSAQAQFWRTFSNHFHILGDSFASAGFRTAVAALIAPRVLTIDGIGGSTLAQQAARWAMTPAMYDDTLISTDDMAPWSDSPPDIAAMLAPYVEIFGRLTGGRFMIMEPGLPVGGVGGSPSRAVWENKWAAIKATYPNNYVPVLATMQANGDGSALDNDFIAANLWPASCYVNPGTSPVTVVDGHPNTKGNNLYGLCAYNFAVSKGWA